MSAKIKVPKKRKAVSFAEPEPEAVASEADDAEDFAFEPQLPPGLLDDLNEVTDLSRPVVAEEIIDGDAEVWILQCPSDVNLKEILKGKEVCLEGRCDLAQDDTKCAYETLGFPCVPNPGEKPPSVAALLPSGEGGIKLVSKVVKGHITVRQRIAEQMIPKIEVSRKKHHKIPKFLKQRHPLYGLDLGKILEQRGVGVGGSEQKKHSKRKEARETVQYISDDSIDEKIAVPEESPVKKKSKKSKLKEEPDVDVTYEEVTIGTKRKKKDKRDREVEAKLKEQNSIDDEVPPVKIKKEKKSKYDISEVPSEVIEVEKSRKSKKSKRRD